MTCHDILTTQIQAYNPEGKGDRKCFSEKVGSLEYQDHVNNASDFDRWALLVACWTLLVACRALFDGIQGSFDEIFGF